MNYKIITNLSKIKEIPENKKKQLEKVTKIYPFKANEYYLSLINWENENDPIKKLIIPDYDEISTKWGNLDPSNEKKYTVMKGLEHKYPSVCLILVSNVCAGICRYCFRKRLFKNNKKDYLTDYDEAFKYIKKHKEINNVLITGGDPFILKTERIKYILEGLRKIEHVKIIRFGTRMPQFFPMKISEDRDLLNLIKTHSSADKRIYIITHYVHNQEITKESVNCIDALLNSGAIVANQTPLIRGINDNPQILADLFNKLSYIGVPPYYVFQCRPASGNKIYNIPIEKGYLIFEKAKNLCSGLAKRARYVMSHSTGKIEIVAMSSNNIFFKYHRAANPNDSGKLMIFRRNPEAVWFDDYTEKPLENFNL